MMGQMCQLILQQYNEHSSQLFLNKCICIWHSWQVNRIPQTVQLLDRIQIYSWFLYFQAGHLHKSERWILWDAILVHQNKSVLKLLHFLNKPAFVTWIHWAKHCQGSLEIIHSQHYLVNTKVKLQIPLSLCYVDNPAKSRVLNYERHYETMILIFVSFSTHLP